MKLKVLSTFLIVVGSMMAQSQQPIALTKIGKNLWQGKNVSGKEILAHVTKFENPHLTIYTHDHYFRPDGLMPDAVESFEEVDDANIASILWVQYVDGTEWGDHEVGRTEVINNRGPQLQRVTEMVGAYEHGGDKELSDYLFSHKEPDVQHMLRTQQRAGMDGVLGRMKMFLSSAAKHDKTLQGK
jgi:hypothetical protein